MENNTKSGFIAIVGRPNVGKSTLLNRLIGEKISITADKPQTTRHKISGVKTIGNKQAIYIDTPGIHKCNKRAINQQMNRLASSVLKDVDAIIFIIEALNWLPEDDLVLNKISKASCSVFLLANKIDLYNNKSELLPFLDQVSKKMKFTEVIPISAKKDIQIDILEQKIFTILPTGPFYYPQEQITDRTQKFRMAEIIREKLTRILQHELPYALTVNIESLQQEQDQIIVHAVIWVEKSSQKQIVIGKKGEMLKAIGTKARLEINKIFNCRIHLQLWVKVQKSWSNNKKALQDLGYIEID